MNEQSDGEKGKPPDSQDVKERPKNVVGSSKEIDSESASRAMVESSLQEGNQENQDENKSDKVPNQDRMDRKPPPKLNGVKTGTVRNRREDERRLSPHKPTRKIDGRGGNMGSFKRDGEKVRSPSGR